MSIYNFGQEIIPSGGMSCENISARIEDKFVESICNLILESLNVRYEERRLMKPLLTIAISEKINNRRSKEPGLLQQFEAYVLETSSKRFIEEFNLVEVKVNHDHATHAKFADIVKAIKAQYVVENKES